MKTTNKNTMQWAGIPLAVAITAGLCSPAMAYKFNFAGIEGSLDNRITAGVTVRTASQDKDLIGQGNLGPEFAFSNTGASSNNYDDGNLNFERGDFVSQQISGRSDLFLQYFPVNRNVDRVGAFVRARYYYDHELKDNRRAKDSVGQRRELNDKARDNAAGIDLLDAYVLVDGFIDNRPVSARYGRQVLNWGESTFIQGGLNSTNPIDVRAFRSPGTELEDALLPVEMFYTSVGVTPDLTLEGFVQTSWEKFEIDDCGTFFSNVDFVADGCGPVLLAGEVPDTQARDEGFVAEREGDRRPGDKDQFGVAARYFSTALDAEIGLYFMRYHSRVPLISGRVNNPESPDTNQDNNPDRPFSEFPSYFTEYPKGIEQYGISMSTTLPNGTSIGGEYSLRRNLPLQHNAFELIFGGVQARGPNDEILSRLEKQRRAEEPGENPAGRAVEGFDRFDVSQIQSTIIHFMDRVMGADRFIIIAEAGATYVHDLPSKSEARYGRSGIYGIGTLEVEGDDFTGDVCTEGANINPSNCSNDGFTTPFSWGYRALFAWQYQNALAGVNLTPQVFFSHDVKGFAPEPAANFREGDKEIGLALSADYLNAYTAEISYTSYFGGKFNDFSDRDFLSASISYSF